MASAGSNVALQKAAASGDNDAEASARRAIEADDHKAALRELENLYGASVYRYIRGIVGNDDVAHDVWQNTFLQAFRDIVRFRGGSRLKTWLYSIARHRSLDALRDERRRTTRFRLASQPPEVADAQPNPDERLLHRQLAVALESCLGELTAEARAAVLLRYREGFSYKEMESICGERQTTLRARVSRAMPVLRRCLEAKQV